MSWSKSASGTIDDIINAAANWPGEIDAVDKTYGASDELRAGHRRQANAALGAITEFAQELPEGRKLSAYASGHANGDGTGNVSVQITEAIDVKPEAESVDDTSTSSIPDAAGASGVAEQVGSTDDDGSTEGGAGTGAGEG